MNVNVDLRMFRYVNTALGTSVVIMNSADEVVINNVKFVREDKVKKPIVETKLVVKEEKK